VGGAAKIGRQVVDEPARRRPGVGEEPHVHPADPIQRGQSHQKNETGDPYRLDFRGPLA
jgi:hypothetical protein